MAMLEALDAATGEYLFTLDSGVQNVIADVDPNTGAKTFDPKQIPNAKTPCVICPSAFGARSWPQTAFSPRTKMAYVPITEWCIGMSTTSNKRQMLSSGVELSHKTHPDVEDGMMGRVQAFDVANQKLGWTFDQTTPPSTGLLATAGGLVFSGDIDPSMKAFDDATGELLWQAPLDESPSSSLVTYSINGTQYVAVVVGMTNNWVRDITTAHNMFAEDTGFSSQKSKPGGMGGAAIWAFALQKFVRDWKVDDLASSLDELNQGRSFANGQKVYQAASCKACHRFGDGGASIGPNLNEMSQRMRDGKLNRLGLLTEVVQPSKVIDEKFRTQIISTEQGRLISGVVIHEDDQVVRLLSNPLDEGEKPKEVAKSEIDERVASETSLMPPGLLNTLTKEDILDLLAYLESAGDPAHGAFRD
jgi:putative heme-binding domain-containing protein